MKPEAAQKITVKSSQNGVRPTLAESSMKDVYPKNLEPMPHGPRVHHILP